MRLVIAFATLILLASTTVQANSVDVLYIGDSHSYGCFGQQIDHFLRQQQNPSTKRKYDVISTAVCGSSAHHWLSQSGPSTNCGFRSCDANSKCTDQQSGHSPNLEKALENKPRLVIVALGTNMIKEPLAKTKTDIAMVIQKIHKNKSQCIWIGPPQPDESFISPALFARYVESLQKIISAESCQFIDSATKTHRENLSDPLGLHYSCKDAKIWAEKTQPELKKDIARAFLSKTEVSKERTSPISK
jgi:hypothetical protein